MISSGCWCKELRTHKSLREFAEAAKFAAMKKVGGEQCRGMRYCRCRRREKTENGKEQAYECRKKDWRSDGQGRSHGAQSSEGRSLGQERAEGHFKAGGSS